MEFNEIDALTSTESQEKARKAATNRKQKVGDLAKSYARLFKTTDGNRVLTDLTARFIVENNTSFDSSNINYVAAYKNGESGAIKFIIHQMTTAGKI